MNTHRESETSASIVQCTAILREARNLLVITGAGISKESGLPTYRGQGGIYDKDAGLMTMLSAEGFENDPCAVWRYLDDFRIKAAGAVPNAAHRVLAQWEAENRFDRFLVATQNIDGLHQAAGSVRVSELHGSVWQMACPKSDEYAGDSQFSSDASAFMSSTNREKIVERWSKENNQRFWEDHDVPFEAIPPYNDPSIRPNIVFFDEGYGNRLLWVEHFIRNKPDALLVIGCSGAVYILDRLVRSCHNASPACKIVNINAHEDPIILPHLHIPIPAARAIVAINHMLQE